MSTPPAPAPWTDVCALAQIIPDTAVGALIGSTQIAVVRVGAGSRVYAMANFDPFSKAFVLARGIVGDSKGIPKITSPVYKQGFDLRDGRCLDVPGVSVPVYPVRVRDGRVQVQVEP